MAVSPELAIKSDYYRLAYALGLYDRRKDRLRPGCVCGLVRRPDLWASYLRHALDSIRAHRHAGPILESLDFARLRPMVDVADQWEFWRGYYAGLFRAAPKS